MSTTTPAAATGLWHGLVALGQHMHTHGLPDPSQIDVEERGFSIHVRSHDGSPWEQSLHVDGRVLDNGPGSLDWMTVTGRLPDTGVRVRLIYLATTGPVASLAETVPEVLTHLDASEYARCEHCKQELGVGMATHGAERGDTLCSDCCHASNPCSWRACCDEGALR